MRALVIGGGGNKGAGGAGKVAAINGDYDLGIGVSTGALMLVPALLGEHDLLKSIYTNVTQEDIFDKGQNPFKKNGNVKIFYLIWRLLRSKPTLGESHNLKKLLKKVLTENMFNQLKQSGKEALVGVYNDTDQRMEYYSSKDCSYEDFICWTWASACQPPAMTIYRKDGKEYVDGGVQEVFPMTKALELGAKHVTGILHRPQTLPVVTKSPIKNVIHHVYRLILGMRREITNDDILRGIDACKLKKAKFELHFVKYGYGENDLVFNKEKMLNWWESANSEELKPVTSKKGLGWK